MTELSEPTQAVLCRLSDRHRAALTWFAERAGEVTGWPDPLPDGTLLACRPKGIYKPRWSDYALSIRQSLNSPYPDGMPTASDGQPWNFPYFQESLDVGERDQQFTNIALQKNQRDGVPVGVLIQVQAKPKPEYEILGLGTVGPWNRGYFPITQLR